MEKKSHYYSNTSAVDEAIRTLRTNISFSSADKKIKSILFTSSQPSEGKSTVALKLAEAIASAGQRVLLIDCDLRNPTIGKLMDNRVPVGVTNFLVKGLSYTEIINKSSKNSNLDFVLTGPTPPNPSELLGSDKMRKFIKDMEDIYNMVIVDSPPAGILTDGQILSTMVDGVILVIAQGEAKTEEISRTIANLNTVGANILGSVFNKVKIERSRYGYGYGYGYGVDQEKRKKK